VTRGNPSNTRPSSSCLYHFPDVPSWLQLPKKVGNAAVARRLPSKAGAADTLAERPSAHLSNRCPTGFAVASAAATSAWTRLYRKPGPSHRFVHEILTITSAERRRRRARGLMTNAETAHSRLVISLPDFSRSPP
jgi:hypothetical protein